MKKEILFQINAVYRDNFRITGYRFGEGEESACIVGSMRGNEYQQIYTCSQLIQKLRTLEEKGRILPGKKIIVIPCANPYSANVKKRFWTIDNTDINRMFPGYGQGETTQRIAGGIFEKIKGYRFGIQFASFYMPGDFVPQVRMMKTGLENVGLAKQFGLPYVVLHTPRPFDTATLNYNWQIWETDAFSVYTTSTGAIDTGSADQAVSAVLNFLSKQGIIDYRGYEGYISRVVDSGDFVSLRTKRAGFFMGNVKAGQKAVKGETLARITDPYTGEVRQVLQAPEDGVVAFVHNETLAYQQTAVIKLIKDSEML